jgi:hypothetical protein
VQYEHPPVFSRDELQRQLKSDSPDQVAHALVSAAFHEADWRWVQDWCIRLTAHADLNVRLVAIISLGHIARIHHCLDLGRVLPLLALKAKESALEGTVEDTLSDIRMFIPGCVV